MIRLIEDKDLRECLDIFNYYVLNTDYSFETDKLTEEKYLERIHNITKTYPWIVYEEDGQILGFAYLADFNYRKAYQYTADLTIYLHHEHLGRGIGRRLYDCIEDLARKMGICTIISLITANNKGSLKFHERIGFSYLCTIENVAYKFNKWCHLTYYSKVLSLEEPNGDIRTVGDIDGLLL